MAISIDLAQFRARLDEFIARAAAGERILVRNDVGHTVVLAPAELAGGTVAPRTRRRYRAHRTIAEVMADDRGA